MTILRLKEYEKFRYFDEHGIKHIVQILNLILDIEQWDSNIILEVIVQFVDYQDGDEGYGWEQELPLPEFRQFMANNSAELL